MKYGSVKISPAPDGTGFDVLIQDDEGHQSQSLSFEESTDLVIWLQTILDVPYDHDYS